MSSSSANNPIDLTNIPRPTRSVQPNCLAYTDDAGVQHRIYLRQGELQRASKLYEDKNWAELAKYEPYTNQGYQESDYKTIEQEGEGQ